MTRPAALRSIPYEEYAALGGVNWSTLGKMRASPAHYQHALTHPRPPTADQSTGSAVHTLVLEPEEFAERYAVYLGEGTRASKEYRAFVAETAGDRQVLKLEEYSQITAMGEAVMSHAIAGPLFVAGWAEQSIQWTDPATGLGCKGRVDWLYQLPTGQWVLVDLKTARSSDAREFGRSAASYGYHLQLAHYVAGLRVLGVEVAQVLIVVVESSAPYDVCVYELTDDQLQRATADVAALLERVRQCEESGEWPGRCSEITPIDLPAWVMGSDDVTLWGAT